MYLVGWSLVVRHNSANACAVVPSAAYDVVEDGNACSALTEPVQDNHLALDDGIVLRVA